MQCLIVSKVYSELGKSSDTSWLKPNASLAVFENAERMFQRFLIMPFELQSSLGPTLSTYPPLCDRVPVADADFLTLVVLAVKYR